jgi:uncharacterized protein (UPF0276 family)
MSAIDQDFLHRVSLIPPHGLGLSVDVYQPDLFTLVTELDARRLSPDYLEVFKASTPALNAVRRRLPSMLLAYHAEGLWVTQPDFVMQPQAGTEVMVASEHLRTLGSWWINCEGATKQMAGYSFGTYLPPLFTQASAEVTAENIAWVQERLDHLAPRAGGVGPLFLLETPPLTYFGFGDLDMAEFFRRVAERVPCGIVLDIGHLWTVYRYSESHRQPSIEHFLRDFLERFPLERVVHIHVAGLAEQHQMQSSEASASLSPGLPWWIDAHGAPIPTVLFDMLEQVLSHPGLAHTKGLALEVDTKSVPEIIDEFQVFQERFAPPVDAAPRSSVPSRTSGVSPLHMPDAQAVEHQRSLLRQYETYVQVVTSDSAAEPDSLPSRWLDRDGLLRYRHVYLPNEILCWGGDLHAMFPETCRKLEQAGISLDGFVGYWFREPRECDPHYDFFELKVNRFAGFVREAAPQATECVAREAEALLTGYREACEHVTGDL